MQFQETLDENFLNSNSNEFFTNLLSLFRGELKYLLYAMNKVAIATKIPKKPRISIGEFGKSYTGTFIVIGSKNWIRTWKVSYAFLPFATMITGINK